MYNAKKTVVSLKSEFTWNILGSITYAASSLIYLLIVTRSVGANDAGVFAIAFANAQLMLAIGRYGMRTFQSTDIKGQYSFGTYLVSRICTCIAMLLVNFAYIVLNGFSLYKSYIILWVCVLKMLDAVEDVFHGLFQVKSRLDISGKLQMIRNVFSVVVFFAAILITRQLLFTCILTSILSLIICLSINIPFAAKYDNISLNFSVRPLKRLLIDCFPLFAATFLSIYIYNAPKYAIDRYLIEEMQTYYSILFMPTFIINLFSEFAFKPLLVRMADLWINDKARELMNSIIKLLGWIALLSIVALIGGYILAIPFLSLIYGIDLTTFKEEFMILLLGGCFGAAVWLINNVLTTIRKQKALLISYLIIAVLTRIISPLLVQKGQVTGASFSYLFSIATLFLILSIVLLYYVKVKKSR